MIAQFAYWRVRSPRPGRYLGSRAAPAGRRPGGRSPAKPGQIVTGIAFVVVSPLRGTLVEARMPVLLRLA